jgi:drug/metabolite transporter (DMT)-like permease
MTRSLAVLALVFNALVWGVSWWPFRALEAQGIHPLWTTAFVFAVALVVIGVSQPSAWRRVATTPALWALMLASGCTNAAFNWGVVAGDVVRVVLLFYLMPLWVVLLARWVLHEPITPTSLLRVALSLAGALVVLWPTDGRLPWPREAGDWLGLAGGFFFALNNVILRRAAHRPEADRALAMFVGGVLVSTVLASVLTAQGGAALPQLPTGSGWVIALALSAGFLASNLALQYGAARLSANITSVVMLTEVLFASVSALWLGGGAITLQLALGGALIVAAAVLAAWQAAPAKSAA